MFQTKFSFSRAAQSLRQLSPIFPDFTAAVGYIFGFQPGEPARFLLRSHFYKV
jgi:hypothetical protein